MSGLRAVRPERASSITRVINDKGHHGENRGKNDKRAIDKRFKTEKYLLCGLPDSADQWLHNCSFKSLRAINDAVLRSLQLKDTECRQLGPLHRRLSYVFQSILYTTD